MYTVFFRAAARRLRIVAAAAALLVPLAACEKAGDTAIRREDLWSFKIGRLEDQLDLYNLQGERSGERTAISMRDGLFYIANGPGDKVLRYNSYGDLLFMIYNDETNPEPLTLKSRTDSTNATRWSIVWPLQEPCAIAVDSRKNIYVADKLSGERHAYDMEERALLNYSVLRFDIDGNFVDYLGQEGPGGRPFPRIDNIYTSVNDELAVVCQLPKGMAVFWFNSQGSLLYNIRIKNDALPTPPDRGGLLAVLNGISAAPDSQTIYLKIDYYREIQNEMTQTISGMEPDGAVLWAMDAASALFTSNVDIPFYEGTITVNNRRNTENLLYTMFGAMNGGSIFFYFPVENGFSILVLDGTTGEERAHSFIRVDNSELQFFAFDVSVDGILSALLSGPYEAKLVWWRTDRLIG
ncbi:MAG: hypothetical protein LBD20_03675 [Spirochaetaceae bacterium]|jgi:hypothetical protein|nr:hypothetical protein [Spirochaetaceae bacterium]